MNREEDLIIITNNTRKENLIEKKLIENIIEDKLKSNINLESKNQIDNKGCCYFLKLKFWSVN